MKKAMDSSELWNNAKALILTILIFYVAAQLIGLYTGIIIMKDVEKNPVAKALSQEGDPLLIFAYILLSAFVLILVIKMLKFLFPLLEFAALSTALSLPLYAFLRPFLPALESTALGIILALLVALLKFKYPVIKNGAAMLAAAGVGAALGVAFDLYAAFLFLLFFSLYDFVAVFITKHMEVMAREAIKRNAAYTITAVKGGKRMDLGTGDLAAPVMLETAALLHHPIAALFIFAGALISMSLFLWLVWRKKMLLPALPPQFAGMVVLYLIGAVVGAYPL